MFAAASAAAVDTTNTYRTKGDISNALQQSTTKHYDIAVNAK